MENHNQSNIQQSSIDTTEKRHILADETYDLLIKAQEEIFEKIDMKITLRKLIKTLITEEGVKHTTQSIISKYAE